MSAKKASVIQETINEEEKASENVQGAPAPITDLYYAGVDSSGPPNLRKHSLPQEGTDQDQFSKRIRTDSEDWTEDHHRSFVKAVFEIGLKQASPSVIIDSMITKNPNVNSERVKSRLQKFRNCRSKNVAEFMRDYDLWLRRARAVGGDDKLVPVSDVIAATTPGYVLGGEAAAQLTYSCLSETANSQSISRIQAGAPVPASRSLSEFQNLLTGRKVTCPRMTKEEADSPIGRSLRQVTSLFGPLSEQLVRERRTRESQESVRSPAPTFLHAPILPKPPVNSTQGNQTVVESLNYNDPVKPEDGSARGFGN